MSAVSLMFFISSLVYVVTNQVCAQVIQRWCKLARPLILSGFSCSAVMFLLSGPMFPFTFHETVTTVVVRQVIFGLSIGPQMVGSFSDGSAQLKECGLEKDMSTSSAFSALYTTGMTLG